GETGVNCSGHAGRIDLVSVEPHPAADIVAPRTAEQAHREFGAARTHQAGNAHNLAAPDAEVDVLNHLTLGMERMVDRPVLHLQHWVRDVDAALRKAMGEIAIDHAADDPIFLHRLGTAVDAVHRATIP